MKTLTDQNGSALLSSTPVKSSVDKMVVVRPPKVLHADNMFVDGRAARYTSENNVVEFTAFVTDVKNEIDDSDLHFVLKSPNSEKTMVGEIPDPNCPSFDHFPQQKSAISASRKQGMLVMDQMKRTNKPVKVKITGVPFWDGIHLNTPRGASKYCREIHPILKIEIL